VSVPIPRKPEKHTISELFDELRKFETEFHTKHSTDVLNPRNLLNYCSEIADDEKNLVSIAHCLWGFSRCSQLSTKDDNGYLCEKCSYNIVEEEPAKKAEEEQGEQPQATTTEATNAEASEKDAKEQGEKPKIDGIQAKATKEEEEAEEDSDDEEEDDSEEEKGSEKDKKQSKKSKKNKKKGDEKEAGNEEEEDEEEEAKKKKEKQRPRQLRDAIRQTSFWQPPEILNIHLKRFVREDELHGKRKKTKYSMYSMLDNGGYVKNQEHVQFPFKFDLTPFIHPSSPYAKLDNDYSLYAIVVHQGELNFGHYVAMVRRLHIDAEGNDTRGKWYYISDTHVKEASPKDVKNCGGYMLFYERINKT